MESSLPPHREGTSHIIAAVRRVQAIPPPSLGPATSPSLFASVIGNGRMLAGVDATGSLAQLFYPTIDAGPHIRTLLHGIQIAAPASQARQADPGTARTNVSWLAESDWSHQVEHIDHAAVVRTISTNLALGLRIERRLAAAPTSDVIIEEIRVTNMAAEARQIMLVTYAAFDINYGRSGTTCHVDDASSALTFFANDRYFALSSDATLDEYGCDKTTLQATDQVFLDATVGAFNHHQYAVGQVSGAVRYDLGVFQSQESATQRVYLCGEPSLQDLMSRLQQLRSDPPTIDGVISWWRETYKDKWLKTGGPAVQSTYDRSLIVLCLLTDSASGAIIAAPEVDPDFRSCDGYAYCWPRDGGMIANSLDMAGLSDHARLYYSWLTRTQEATGEWFHRYYTSGKLAPTWGLVQFDETGTSVWSLCKHVLAADDVAYGRQVFPSLEQACKYMEAALDPATGLAPVTRDLWEEHDEISAYACASTWGAFHEFARLAARLEYDGAARYWRSAADKLGRAIETHLWDPDRRRFLRGIRIIVDADALARLRKLPEFYDADVHEAEAEYGRRRYIVRQDPVIDASILSLAYPFRVVPPDDPRIIATAAAVVSDLTTPSGGIMRYKGDNYRGGNAWPICTLWLAWQELMAGDRKAARHHYEWALNHRTALDLLPEQVDYASGDPAWVTPLGWSHAVFIAVTLAFAEQHALPEM